MVKLGLESRCVFSRWLSWGCTVDSMRDCPSQAGVGWRCPVGAGLCWARSSPACPWAPGTSSCCSQRCVCSCPGCSRVLLDHGGPFTLFFPQECPIPFPVPSEIPFHILETNKVQTSGKFR